MDQEKIGKFISKLRKEKKLTQLELGRKLGVTDKTVYKWEKGITAPGISILNDLSRELGITVTELLSGERKEKLDSKDIDRIIPENIDFYNKIDRKKYFKRFSIALTILIILFFIIIGIAFFNNNYDNCYIYELKSKNSAFQLEGHIIFTPEKDIINIASIENTNNELKNELSYSYEFSLILNDEEVYKNGNILLYEHQSEDQTEELNSVLEKIRIYIKEDSNYNLSIPSELLSDEKITLNIKYINQELKIKEIKIPLQFTKLFSNNKITYNKGKKF